MTCDARPLRVLSLAERIGFGGIRTYLRTLDENVRGMAEEVEQRLLLLDDPPRGLRRCVGEVRRALRAWRPDVLHAHGLRAEVLGALASTGLDIALVATVHSDPGTRAWRAPDRRTSASLALWCARRARAARLIAVTDDIRDRLMRSGIPAERIVRVHNGVPAPAPPALAREALRARMGVEADEVAVVAAGRLEPVKGYDVLLRAFAHAARRSPTLALRLVGEGPLRRELVALAEALGVPERVRLLGHRDDLPELLWGADLGVFTSRHEGLPFAALELLSRGVPLVAFATGGLSEILAEGSGGVRVAPGDAAELADALAALAGDPLHRQRLGREAAELARRRFAADRMARETLAVWRAPCGTQRAGERVRLPA